MVIEMVDGPMSGLVHEIAEDVAIPSFIGLLKAGMRHWYAVNAGDGIATYSHSEADGGLQGGPSEREAAKAENLAMMREIGWWVCQACKLWRPPILKSDGDVCKICKGKVDD
jgi:hypothetical protein